MRESRYFYTRHLTALCQDSVVTVKLVEEPLCAVGQRCIIFLLRKIPNDGSPIQVCALLVLEWFCIPNKVERRGKMAGRNELLTPGTAEAARVYSAENIGIRKQWATTIRRIL